MNLYRKKLLIEAALLIVETAGVLALAGFLFAAILLRTQGIVFTEQESRAILSPSLVVKAQPTGMRIGEPKSPQPRRQILTAQ